MTEPTITPASRVALRPLRGRRSGDEYHLGRPETGEFVALPPIAEVVVGMLDGARSVCQVEREVAADHDADLDVVDFVTELVDLGFVASVDGHRLADSDPGPGSLAWITPARARWALHPATALVCAGVVLSGAVLLGSGAVRVPAWHDLFWNDRFVGMTLVVNAVLGWSLVLAHELAHLVTARAAGAPARLSLGSRLQFLVAQTDVSGVRAEPLRVRLTVYLSGIVLNLMVATGGLWVQAFSPGDGPLHRVAATVALVSALMVLPQLLVFMRTDLYFVLADLLRVPNLYAEAAGLARRVLRRRPGSATAPEPAHRRAIAGYCVVLVLGTVACLGFFVVVSVPYAVGLVLRTVAQVSRDDLAGALDAAALLAYVAAVAALWSWAWWRRHGPRVRRHTARVRSEERGR